MSSVRPDTGLPVYHLRVENFGKLAAADVRVGSFTVLAGPNNTGKSFVSKLLYSVFSALNVDLPRVRVSRLVSQLTRQVIYLQDELPTAESLRRVAQEMEQVARSYSSGEIDGLDEVARQLNLKTSKVKSLVDKATQALHDGTILPTERLSFRRTEFALSVLQDELPQLTSALAEASDLRTFSLAELQDRTTQALNLNFQVPEVASLAGDGDRELLVDVEDLLRLVANRDGVDLSAPDPVAVRPMDIQNLVYIESPVYWKLFDALKDLRRLPPFVRPRRGRHRLTGVPDYFYHLADTITHKYTGEMSFPDVYRQLVQEDMINGRVAVSESGDIVFEEAGRSFPLVTAASGVANIGFLAMLIERKVIDHDTMLFIDEPEAHLHPAWQVVVADALFQLAREGVRVVLATHSLDILKWLEVHIKNNPGHEEYVALNRFPNPSLDENLSTKLAGIKDDLTKPFVDLYMRGL